MKKYEITDIAHPDNPKLHRIRALTDLTEDVLAGMLGGYVESYDTSTKRGVHGFRRMPSPVKMQLSAAMQSLQNMPLQEVMPMSARTPP